MLSRKSLLTYTALGALALGTWWAAEILLPKEEAPGKGAPGKVDYYSRNLRRTVMDEFGKPKELLVAETLVHYENDNHTELTRPVMTLYSKEGPPWVIHADSAVLPGQGDDVFLYGNVLVLRDADKNGRTVRIETTNARVQPKNNYAETDEFIRVLSPPDTMTGTGAKVNFGDNLSYTILSDVRRKHEVQEQSSAPP
jgi:lipopolysaccharide export system protein LptC